MLSLRLLVTVLVAGTSFVQKDRFHGASGSFTIIGVIFGEKLFFKFSLQAIK